MSHNPSFLRYPITLFFAIACATLRANVPLDLISSNGICQDIDINGVCDSIQTAYEGDLVFRSTAELDSFALAFPSVIEIHGNIKFLRDSNNPELRVNTQSLSNIRLVYGKLGTYEAANGMEGFNNLEYVQELVVTSPFVYSDGLPYNTQPAFENLIECEKLLVYGMSSEEEAFPNLQRCDTLIMYMGDYNNFCNQLTSCRFINVNSFPRNEDIYECDDYLLEIGQGCWPTDFSFVNAEYWSVTSGLYYPSLNFSSRISNSFNSIDSISLFVGTNVECVNSFNNLQDVNDIYGRNLIIRNSNAHVNHCRNITSVGNSDFLKVFAEVTKLYRLEIYSESVFGPSSQDNNSYLYQDTIGLRVNFPSLRKIEKSLWVENFSESGVNEFNFPLLDSICDFAYILGPAGTSNYSAISFNFQDLDYVRYLLLLALDDLSIEYSNNTKVDIVGYENIRGLVSGLENIYPQTQLSIGGCPNLSSCSSPGICEFVSSHPENSYVEGNDIGCSSIQEIQSGCLSEYVLAISTPQNKICDGSNAIFTITGAPNSQVNFNLLDLSGSITLDESGYAELVYSSAGLDYRFQQDTLVLELISDVSSINQVVPSHIFSDTILYVRYKEPNLTTALTNFGDCITIPEQVPYILHEIQGIQHSKVYFSYNTPVQYAETTSSSEVDMSLNTYPNFSPNGYFTDFGWHYWPGNSVFQTNLLEDSLGYMLLDQNALVLVPENYSLEIRIDSIDYGGCIVTYDNLYSIVETPSAITGLYPTQFAQCYEIQSNLIERPIFWDYPDASSYLFVNYFSTFWFPNINSTNGLYEAPTMEFEYLFNGHPIHFDLNSSLLNDTATIDNVIITASYYIDNDGVFDQVISISPLNGYFPMNDTISIQLVSYNGNDGCIINDSNAFFLYENDFNNPFIEHRFILNPTAFLPSDTAFLGCNGQTQWSVPTVEVNEESGFCCSNNCLGSSPNLLTNDISTPWQSLLTYICDACSYTEDSVITISEPGTYYYMLFDVDPGKVYVKTYIVESSIGTSCNDSSVCTINDLIQPDCSCAGTFADADNDGTCDANDSCAGPEAGTACDDNNIYTENDIILENCSCSGSLVIPFSVQTSANRICDGSNATFYVYGSPNSQVNYKLLNSLDSVSLDNDGSGEISYSRQGMDYTFRQDTLVLELLSYATPNQEIIPINQLSDTIFYIPYKEPVLTTYETNFNECIEFPEEFPFVLHEFQAIQNSTIYFNYNTPVPYTLTANRSELDWLINFGGTNSAIGLFFDELFHYWPGNSVLQNNLLQDSLGYALLDYNSLTGVPENFPLEIFIDSIDYSGCTVQYNGISSITTTPSTILGFSESIIPCNVNSDESFISPRFLDCTEANALLLVNNIQVHEFANYSDEYGSFDIPTIEFNYLFNDQPISFELNSAHLTDSVTIGNFIITAEHMPGSPGNIDQVISIKPHNNYFPINDTISLHFVSYSGVNGCIYNETNAFLNCTGCDNQFREYDFLLNPAVILATDTSVLSCSDQTFLEAPNIQIIEDEQTRCTASCALYGSPSFLWTSDISSLWQSSIYTLCYGCDDGQNGGLVVSEVGSYYYILSDVNSGYLFIKPYLVVSSIGTACDDNDPCTINDIILADCSCAGTFADADNDGTCDANDNCAGPEAGTACNDNDPCTVNDIILADCSCAGTFADTDNDGTCDANDNCAGPEEGAACDDNDPCTINDIILADCSCAGTFADNDNDETCDANDMCAGPEAGSACDDNDPCTVGDVITADCSCAGIFADNDFDGTCDSNDVCSGAEPGSECNDGDPCTMDDIILADCSCAGTFADSDNDGTCDASDVCEGPEPGMSCDDGNPCTINDTIDENCSCRGTAVEPQFSSVSAHACGPYTWNNNTYSQSGTYQVTLQNAAGCDSIAQLVLTVGAPTSSSQSMTACGSYTWNGTTYSQSGTYTFVSTNASGCPNTATLNLTINTLSVAPTGASASQTSVSAGTQVTLTVQGGSLGTGASWKWYRTACGGSLIGTGSSITITANATNSYFARAEGTCNTTACASVTVNVLSTACGPQNVTATATTICAGSSTTLTVTGSTGTGGSWRWYKNGCGSGTCIGTGSSITVSPSSNTTYFVRSEGGSCGTTICRSIAIVVNPLPAKPTNINGITSGLCSMQNVTYTTSNCTGATSYQWTVPSGATIVSGQGTASITVNFSTTLGNNSSCGSPAICVRSGNSCGWSSYYCKDVQLTPSKPGSITGSSTPCRNQPNVYSIPAVAGATSYQWTIPSGFTIQSGQGTTSITVLPGSTSGSIGVRAVNACGTSSMKTKSVRPKSCSSSMPMTFDLWPNPTSERVFFAFDEQQPDLLEIYDLMGKTIYSGTWLPEFDVSNLAGGIYLVRATSGGESVVKRMEVVR